MTTTILTFGPSLARQMNPEFITAHLVRQLHEGKAEGVIQIFVCRSYTPGVLNVECGVDDLEPEQALQALRIAADQLARIHHVAPPASPVLPPEDAASVCRRAEQLVDSIRSSRPEIAPNRDMVRHLFDLPREDAVKTVVEELTWSHARQEMPAQ